MDLFLYNNTLDSWNIRCFIKIFIFFACNNLIYKLLVDEEKYFLIFRKNGKK